MQHANDVNWDDEFTLVLKDMFPNNDMKMEDFLNQQNEIKNIYDENVDPKNLIGYSTLKERFKHYTKEDYIEDEKKLNNNFTRYMAMVIKNTANKGELMAEDSELFAWGLSNTFKIIENHEYCSTIIEQMTRIPLIWDFEFLWNSAADMIIRNNRYDDFTIDDLSLISVGFATARQFNEALFIDIERTVIYKLKEDLKESNYCT